MEKKTIRNKTAIFAAVICCLLVLPVAVYAAYVGKGSKKGVLTSGRFFFESNILMKTAALSDEVDEETAASAFSIPCSEESSGDTVKTVQIRNHGTTGEFNPTDIEYTIRFWIAADDENRNLSDYTYSVTFNGTPTTLTYQNDMTYTGSLTTGGRDSDYFYVKWTKASASSLPENACKIYAFAYPTAPNNMVFNYIGAVMRLTESVDIIQGFHINAIFDAPATTIRNEAAFVYRISVTGEPPLATPKLTVRYNSDKLTLVSYTVSNFDSITVEEDGEGNPTGWTILTVPISADTSYSLRFTRGSSWVSSDESSSALVTYVSPNGNAIGYLTA